MIHTIKSPGTAAILILLILSSLSLTACAGRTTARAVVITTLPPGHTTIVVHGERLYFHDGYFYSPVRRGYRVVVAPVGARLRHLPKHHKIITLRGNVYYHCRDTYYRWDPRHTVYVVVKDPR